MKQLIKVIQIMTKMNFICHMSKANNNRYKKNNRYLKKKEKEN